jgi:hypothetical protein
MADTSLLPDGIKAPIHMMSGGAVSVENNKNMPKEISLFSEIYTLDYPQNETRTNDQKKILKSLGFKENDYTSSDATTILETIYKYGCTSEAGIATDGNCMPMRQLFMSLAMQMFHAMTPTNEGKTVDIMSAKKEGDENTLQIVMNVPIHKELFTTPISSQAANSIVDIDSIIDKIRSNEIVLTPQQIEKLRPVFENSSVKNIEPLKNGSITTTVETPEIDVKTDNTEQYETIGEDDVEQIPETLSTDELQTPETDSLNNELPSKSNLVPVERNTNNSTKLNSELPSKSNLVPIEGSTNNMNKINKLRKTKESTNNGKN